MKRPLAIGALIILGLACFLAISSRAAEPTADDHDTLSNKVTDLMSLVSARKVDDLLQRVGATADPNRANYDSLRSSLTDLPNFAGKYVDSEIVGYKNLGSRYEVVYVMANFQKLPVLFEFDFYKTNNDWQPLKLRTATNFQTVVDALPMEKP